MTKLGENHLFKGINVERFNALPIAVGKDVYYLNEGRSSIAKIQNKKLVHSWTLPHPHSFMCPVVYSNSSDSLYCVRNGNFLLQWNVEEENLKQANRFQFPEDVFCLIPLPEAEPLLLFSSGKYFSCSKLFESECSLDPLQLISLPDKEEIVWADVLSIDSTTNIALLTSNKAKTYTLNLVCLIDCTVKQSFQLSLKYEAHRIKSWCLNKQTCSFIALWSNGDVTSLKLTSKEQKTLLQVPDVFESLTAMDCIDASHIAVLKCDSKVKKSSLEIWDLQFPVLKTKKEFSSCVNFIQLCVLESSIFMLRDKELAQTSVSAQKSTLASAIGSAAPSRQAKEFTWNKGKIIKSTDESTEELNTDDNMISSIHGIALKVMEKGFSGIEHLPEVELVKILQFAVRLKMNPSEKAEGIDPDTLLNIIFSASFSDVALVKCLKSMNLEEAVVTLDALLEALGGKGFGKPKDLQLLSWVCVVLQSHMEVMLLSRDRRQAKLIRLLDARLTQKVSEYQDYETIQNLLWMLQKDKILPETSIKNKYCTETIQL